MLTARRRPRLALVRLMALAGLAALFAVAASSSAVGPGRIACPSAVDSSPPAAGYRRAVETALASRTDTWGVAELSRRNGPTYASVRRYLRPAWWAVGQSPDGRVTASGAYFVPFGQPSGDDIREGLALHVADGSQIISNDFRSRSMSVFVGAAGTERFGECRTRLDGPQLLDGYLPVLEVGYRDDRGILYRQQSFATFLPGTPTPASFVRITLAPGQARAGATRLRLELSDGGLERAHGRLVSGGKTYLYFSGDPALSGHGLTYVLDPADHVEHAIYVVRPVLPQSGPLPFLASPA